MMRLKIAIFSAACGDNEKAQVQKKVQHCPSSINSILNTVLDKNRLHIFALSMTIFLIYFVSCRRHDY